MLAGPQDPAKRFLRFFSQSRGRFDPLFDPALQFIRHISGLSHALGRKAFTRDQSSDRRPVIDVIKIAFENRVHRIDQQLFIAHIHNPCNERQALIVIKWGMGVALIASLTPADTDISR